MSPEIPDRGGPARYPGWLLIILGGAAGGAFVGWWGVAFGAAVGFVIWRSRA